jgi:hypothetical protein
VPWKIRPKTIKGQILRTPAAPWTLCWQPSHAGSAASPAKSSSNGPTRKVSSSSRPPRGVLVYMSIWTLSICVRLHPYLPPFPGRNLPPPLFSAFLADLIPEETKAIDEAGANGPPAPTPSWLRKLPCANVARIRVVLGVLTIPFAIMLLCCLGSPALL